MLSARHLGIGLALTGTVVLTLVVDPPHAVAPPSLRLDQLIPAELGDWKVDPQSRLMVSSPDVEAGLANVYSDVLSRSYVNTHGKRVMLSIAYTGGIDRQMDIHRPEYCYPSQGFDIIQKTQDGRIVTAAGDLPVRRLVARNGHRIEPITYWITIGNEAVSQGWQRKVAKIRTLFTGQVADGVLVRVSSISTDPASAFQEHEGFINELLRGLDPATRKRVGGMPS